MNRLLFAAVADDDTGASDLAGMLAEQDLRTLLVIDLPTPEEFERWSLGYQAVVMAEGTRNVAPSLARERTRAAIRLLQTRRPRLFQIKYCSTFDSTPEGNIGPSIDAALEELQEDFTIALPALPVNGRTTYQGYHFVHHQLLSDSPMRHHPLTPMTNANLVEFLGLQTKRRVGLAPLEVVEAGADDLSSHFRELRRQGFQIAVVDCLSDRHLEIICRATGDLRLITGSSAFGIHLPRIWRERDLIDESAADALPLSNTAGAEGCLVVAGSCSEATRQQNSWLMSKGAGVHKLDAIELLTREQLREQYAKRASEELAAGRQVLLYTSGDREEIMKAQEWGSLHGYTAQALGEAISYALADVVLEVLGRRAVRGLVVAGGETSGAVCRRLRLGALRVGRNIEPGVPLCFSLGDFRLPVVLKSGNFGSRDFYGKAIEAIDGLTQFLA